MISIISKHKNIFILLVVYFILHLPNLTGISIFNDESIYLDWAWSHTHMPGHLYDSLLDAKQPFIIWIFAIFINFFSDPLFAGRLASALIGALTLFGVYLTAKKLFNEKVAFFAGLIFSISPLIVFYNRQALMESGVMCVGIWSFYFFLNLINKPSYKNAIVLGIIFGIGFMIKTSSLLFLVSALLIILYLSVIRKKGLLLARYFWVLASFIVFNFIIFINPVFWENISTNTRYSLSFAEIILFPFDVWLKNTYGFLEISSVFMTPVIFISSLIGIYLMLKHKSKNGMLFIIYFAAALFFEIFLAKSQSTRYIVSFLIFLIIPSAVVLNNLWNGVVWKKITSVLFLAFPFIITVVLIFNPAFYIIQSSKISRFSEMAYITGQTSGFGIKEAVDYIKNNASSSKPNMILFGLNLGNPENAINLYSSLDNRLYGMRIDRSFFQDIENYQCLTSDYPVFFVTRQDQLLGMDNYFTVVQEFPNPYSKYAIRIYTLKRDCQGNSASLSGFYQDAILSIDKIRSGEIIYSDSGN